VGMGQMPKWRQSYPSPETKGARYFGPKKATVVVPSGHGPIVRSPCEGYLGAQYAGIFSATSAYVEKKVRTQFLSPVCPTLGVLRAIFSSMGPCLRRSIFNHREDQTGCYHTAQ
jgi:hypothetical protein